MRELAGKSVAITGAAVGTGDTVEGISWLANPRPAYVTGLKLPVDGARPFNLLRFIPRSG